MQTADFESEHTEGGGGLYICDRGGDILSQWEDNMANITLGTETNSYLEYAPVLKHHHPISSILGEFGGQLERDSILVKTPISQNKTILQDDGTSVSTFTL